MIRRLLLALLGLSLFAIGCYLLASYGGTAHSSTTASLSPGETGWRPYFEKNHLTGSLPVPPQIAAVEERSQVRITIKNLDTQPLLYEGYSAHSPMHYWEGQIAGQWQDLWWTWCGTGASTYQIQPQQTIEFTIHQGFTTMLQKGTPLRLYTSLRLKADDKEHLVLLWQSQQP